MTAAVHAAHAIRSPAFVAMVRHDLEAGGAGAVSRVLVRCKQTGRLRFACHVRALTEADDWVGVRIGARVVRPARRPVVFEDLSGFARWHRGVSSLKFGHASAWHVL